jgi:hypothetical protein
LKQPKNSRMRRLVRRAGLTRNPLCRRVDRLEGAFRVVLTLFVLGALAVATAVGATSYSRSATAAAAERRQLQQVSVVLLEDAPSTSSDPSATASPPQPGVRAKWTLPDGSSRVGAVYAKAGARQGETITTWMNLYYDPVRPPIQRSDLVVRAGLLAIVTASLVCALLTGVYQLARRQLNRRRDAAWTREWLLVSNSWRDRSI